MFIKIFKIHFLKSGAKYIKNQLVINIEQDKLKL